MQEQKLYDFLQGLLPNGLQFMNPFLDSDPVPLDDFVQMTVLPVHPVGLSQQREASFSDEQKTVQVAYDLERIYKVQFDFYGRKAFENALLYQQTLEVNLRETLKSPCTLKTFSQIRNLTDLQENKRFLKRYSFDVDLYIVDSILKEQPYLTTFQNTLVRVGNGEQ